MDEGPYRQPHRPPSELGGLLHRYRGRAGVLLLGIGAVVLLPAVPVLAVVGDAFRGSEVVGVSTFVGFFVLIDALLVSYTINLVRRGIAIHENGFRSWTPGVNVRALWRDVASITVEAQPNGLGVREPVRLELRLRDGRPVQLINDLPQFAELIAEVERLTRDDLVTRALEDVDDGKDVRFGMVVVRRSGVEVKGVQLLWEYRPHFVVRHWTLQLESVRTSSNDTLRLSTVPNAAVLAEVANRLSHRASVSR